MDIWTSWIFGYHGYSDIMDIRISGILGYQGYSDIMDIWMSRVHLLWEESTALIVINESTWICPNTMPYLLLFLLILWGEREGDCAPSPALSYVIRGHCKSSFHSALIPLHWRGIKKMWKYSGGEIIKLLSNLCWFTVNSYSLIKLYV